MRPGSAVWSLSCVLLAACAGVAPDPARASIDDLPLVELSEVDRAARDALVQAAVEAVVQRRYDEAAEAAGEALDRDPRSARAWEAT